MRPDGPRPTVAGPDSGPEAPFPLKLDGKVIKGFGRGSKDVSLVSLHVTCLLLYSGTLPCHSTRRVPPERMASTRYIDQRKDVRIGMAVVRAISRCHAARYRWDLTASLSLSRWSHRLCAGGFQHRVAVTLGSNHQCSSQHAILHPAAVIPTLCRAGARAPLFHTLCTLKLTLVSHQLGIPTANIPLSGLSVGGHEDVESGVYFGWAGLSPSQATYQHTPGTETKYKHMAEKTYESLKAVLGEGHDKGRDNEKDSFTDDRGAVYPMVMSIGWNPFYKNEVRSVEVHIMHQFEKDFYDSHMNIIILGFIRPELDYVDMQSLIDDIVTDINVAGNSLSRPAYAKFYKDPYLLDFQGKSEKAS